VPPACDELPRRQSWCGCINRLTPLHFASFINGSTAVVELLLANGADVNATAALGCGARS
jgi:hypothetical protein